MFFGSRPVHTEWTSLMKIEGACPLWLISGFRPQDRPWPFLLRLSTSVPKCHQAGGFRHRPVHPGFLSFSHRGHADAFFAWPVHIGPTLLLSATNNLVLRGRWTCLRQISGFCGVAATRSRQIIESCGIFATNNRVLRGNNAAEPQYLSQTDLVMPQDSHICRKTVMPGKPDDAINENHVKENLYSAASTSD